MTIEREADLLLVWLRGESNGDTQALVDAEPFWHPPGDDRLVTLIDYLKVAGMVHNTELCASGACSLTPHGVAEAERLIADRDNPRIRLDHALNGLVAAAMENYPTTRLELVDFLCSTRMAVLDEMLEVAEVMRAIEYLEANKIVTVDSRSPQTIRAVTLTTLGIECGFKDPISVRNFLNDQRQPRIHNEWNITVNGGAPQMGQDNTQNNTFGYDPQQLTQFAREVLAAAHSADLPEEVRAVVVGDAAALQAELATAAPEPGRVRQLAERVLRSARSNLPALGWTGVAQLVSANLGIPLF
ncbi:hypothetical protein ACIP6X_07380 [Streptomyces coeruleorubidus]|uniref:hypothetical protein n=1 Tax=Streptomyces coeruleorubidus TaxID=116188 RepID=UPI0037F7324B